MFTTYPIGYQSEFNQMLEPGWLPGSPYITTRIAGPIWNRPKEPFRPPLSSIGRLVPYIDDILPYPAVTQCSDFSGEAAAYLTLITTVFPR